MDCLQHKMTGDVWPAPHIEGMSGNALSRTAWFRSNTECNAPFICIHACTCTHVNDTRILAKRVRVLNPKYVQAVKLSVMFQEKTLTETVRTVTSVGVSDKSRKGKGFTEMV